MKNNKYLKNKNSKDSCFNNPTNRNEINNDIKYK